MVWGAFCQDGLLPIAFPSTRMDSQEYTELLEENLLPFLQQHHHTNWVFQQDNAPVHTSRATMTWFRENHIQVMEWPACSPDQNPMENMWGLIVRAVYADKNQYGSIRDPKRAVVSAWNGVLASTYQRLIKSMPDRLFELIENKGGSTHY